MGFRLAGERLCWCPCHDDCRYTGTVNVTPHEWWASCRCPGSEWMREEGRRRWGRDRPPTLDEVWRASRADDKAWSEVEAAVQPRAAGRSWAEIRELVIEELQSRNRPVPDDAILDRHIERIMDTLALPPPLVPDASAFTALKALVRLAWQARVKHKKIAAARPGTFLPLEGSRGQAPYLVEKDYSMPMADVALDPGATATLNELGKDGIVSLELDPDARVVVYSGKQRLGTLSQEDGARYQPALEAAQHSGRSLMVWSQLSGLEDGTPRLHVYPAGIL